VFLQWLGWFMCLGSWNWIKLLECCPIQQQLVKYFFAITV